MTDARCPKCSEPVAPGSLFCSKCGQDVSTVMPAMDDTLPLTTAGEAPIAPVRTTMRQALRDATLGEYEIMDELGRGGMATVFRAHDISLDRKVAIKVMAPHLLEGEGMAERFKLEARTAAQLSHPHIIPIYAVKETADTLFFVMKYIEGRALDDIIRKSGQLPIAMVRDILIKVGSALGYAHRRDVVHRDIKPGNVMIDEEGTPIVTDFGIAKVAESTGLTMTGTTIGTPSYMSPEQCQAKEVAGASDQYSLGVVAFEMLTGRIPFEGDSAVATMYKHCHDPLPPLEDFRPDCPPELVEAVSRMLAKDPADRWPSMEAAIQKLGTAGTSNVDPVRAELIALAREAGSDELLARLSDPSISTAATGEGEAGSTGGSAAARGEGRSRALAAASMAALALVGIGALAALQPWRSVGNGGGVEPSAQVEDGPGSAVDGPGDGGSSDGDLAAGGGDAGDAPGDDGSGAEPAAGVDDSGLGAVAAENGDSDPPPEAGASTEGAGDDPASGDDSASGVTPAGPEVPQWVVDDVSIDGAPSSLEVGQAAQLSAAARDSRGRAVPTSVIDGCRQHGWSRCGVEWSSSAPAVLAVDAGGRVRAVSPGQATVAASIGGMTASASVLVTAVPVEAIRVAPGSLVMETGQEETLTATALDANGGVLDGRAVLWTSTAANLASVDAASGVVRALRRGSATITASADGASVDVAVEVRPNLEAVVDFFLERWTRAFESRDVDALQSVAPLEEGAGGRLRGLLQNASEIGADMTVESIERNGDEAVARIGGQWRWTDRQAGRQTFTPSFLVRLRRGPNGWQPVGMQFENR